MSITAGLVACALALSVVMGVSVLLHALAPVNCGPVHNPRMFWKGVLNYAPSVALTAMVLLLVFAVAAIVVFLFGDVLRSSI